MKYFKIVPIEESEFMQELGFEPLGCLQESVVSDGVCYVAINDERENTLTVDIDCFDE